MIMLYEELKLPLTNNTKMIVFFVWRTGQSILLKDQVLSQHSVHGLLNP